MSKEYCYLVQYTWGSHGDYSKIELFVTKDFDIAQKYIDKFNAMLNKWTEYYDQFKDKLWYDDVDGHKIERWNQLYEINKAYITKIQYK